MRSPFNSTFRAALAAPPATMPRISVRTAVAPTCIAALLAVCMSASTLAGGPDVPSVTANADGHELTLVDSTAHGHLPASDLRWRFVDPERGAVSVSMRIDGPPPLRDGAFDVGAASAAGPYWITANCILTNTSTTTQLLGCTLMLPVTDPSVTLGGGDLQGITFAVPYYNGGSLFAPPGGAVAQFRIDGVLVAELLQDPFAIPCGLPCLVGPAAWGDSPSIPSLPVPAPAVDMSLNLGAQITSGATVVFSASYAIN